MFDSIHLEEPTATSSIVHEYTIASRYNEEELSWEIPLHQLAQMHLDTMSKKALDRNWKLHELFGTIAVINLPIARERLRKVTEELHTIGTDTFEVFPAVNGCKDVDPSIWKKFFLNLHHIDISTEDGKLAFDRLHQGQAGCYLSHYRLIQKMKAAFEGAMEQLRIAKETHNTEAIALAEKEALKHSRVLILEDDSRFGFLNEKTLQVSQKGIGTVLHEALLALPDDWDMLYLIVNATEPTSEIAPHLRKLGTSWCLTAHVINHTMYGPLVDLLSKIEDPSITQVLPVDNEISAIHHLYNVYAIYPSVVFCDGGLSYITSKTWDPWQGQPIYHQKKPKSKK